MEKSKPTTPEPKATSTWERLEDFVRDHVQQFIQALLEEEVTELLGRTKSARRGAVDAAPGYRNGCGKPRRLTLTNVLDALPKKLHAEARTLLCAMPYAETQAACEALREQFTTRYRKLAPKAVERLADDWERLVTFYQFPHEHWPHLRTTNVVESPFATVRLHHRC